LERKCVVSSPGSRLEFCTAQKQDIFNPYEQSYTLSQHAVQTAIWSVVQRWPWIRSRPWQDFALLFRSRYQNFVKKGTWIRSHFLFSAVAGVCVDFVNVITLSKVIAEFRLHRL